MQRFSNINSILAFVTVARQGGVSRAAEVLNLTQPAISHQIKRLSADTGLVLFTRSASGMQITEDGKALLDKAELVLAAMRDFHHSAGKRAEQICGRLRIGTIVDPEFIRLGQVLSRLRAIHPGIETELKHGVSGEVLNWLQQGRIDVGYYLCGPEDLLRLASTGEDAILATRLANFNYRVIAPAGWQKQVEQADWAQLARLPWIGTPETSVHHQLLAQIFAQIGCSQNVVARVDQEASMLEMVRSGVGLSLCRESIALHQKQSFGLAVSDGVRIPACLSCVTLARNQTQAAVTVFGQLLQGCWE